jgi:hypothetical protein
MAAVEIHQGRRTVLEYLLSPVAKAVREAGREMMQSTAGVHQLGCYKNQSCLCIISLGCRAKTLVNKAYLHNAQAPKGWASLAAIQVQTVCPNLPKQHAAGMPVAQLHAAKAGERMKIHTH